MKKLALIQLACIVAAVMFMLALPTCGRGGPEVCVLRGQTMGTTYTIKAVYAPDVALPPKETLQERIDQTLADVNEKMSTYDPGSELSRFNQAGADIPFPVSDDTFAVFSLAKAICAKSGGAFDPTVGPLVNAWGFGPNDGLPEGPAGEELDALRERVGFDKVQLLPDERALVKSRDDIYCDLSAIAKGFGVDRVAEELDALGFEGYMVEVGGEVRTRGVNANGVPWRIAIEQPDQAGRSIHRIVPLSGFSMATSGDYRNYYERDGVRISHTIDPRTGRPIAHKLASASVVSKRCSEADGWATALMVLGPKEGYELAEREELAALLLVRSGEGFEEVATTVFREQFFTE